MAKKVLIIAAGLHIGGAERVAANISKYAPDDFFEFHYLIFKGHDNIYSPEILEKGGKIFEVSPPRENYLHYLHTLISLMREHHYVAVHSHTMFNSGLNMLAASITGVPVRISHSHTTKTETAVSLAQKIYEWVMRRIINCLSNGYFACGVDAGNWLFGQKKFERQGCVIKNGIETDRFAWSPENRKKIREQHGIDRAFVIGHTGSLVAVKNQEFLIKQMPKVLEMRPDAILMLVGGGDDQELVRLKKIAEENKVSEHVIFTGAVQNVNEYLSAFDVFAFPSTREGTPLSILEAQTNGLPCVVSANVPPDVFLTDLISVVSLKDQDVWIQKLCDASRICPEKYQNKIVQKGYDANFAYQPVYDAYLAKKNAGCAAVSLSFDDGRADNTQVIDEITLLQNIPVTLNVTTGYIDGTCPEKDLPTDAPPMAKEDILRLGRNSLVEIALHGDRHKNSASDILEGRRKLIAWFNLEDDHKFGMASPGCGLDREKFALEEYEEVRKNLIYLRIGLRNYSWNRVRSLARKAGRVMHCPWLYQIAYQDTLMRFCDGKIVYSVPVMGDTSFQQVRRIIDSAVAQQANVTLMFHTISKNEDNHDAWSWSWTKFEMLCEYLGEMRDSGKLTICTTRDLFQKMR